MDSRLDALLLSSRSDPSPEFSRLERDLEATRSPADLCHYTNDAGFFGILNSGEIRCSDTSYLNDPSEIQYGIDIFYKLAEDPSCPDDVRTLVNQMKSFIDEAAVQYNTSYFCSSFSSKENDLSQWRAYGDNGRGLCLVFDGPKLEVKFRSFSRPSAIFQNFKVSYDRSRLEKVYTELLGRNLQALERLDKITDISDADLSGFRELFFIDIFIAVAHIALFFKDDAYQSEDEYRLLYGFFWPLVDVADLPKITKENRSYSISKFIQFPWRESSVLKRVIVGPNAGKHTEKFAKDCLREFELEGVKVEKSAIPYKA